MRYFSRVKGPDVFGFERYKAERRAISCHKLNLVSLAITVNKNNRSNVSGLEMMIGKRSGKDDRVMLLDSVRTPQPPLVLTGDR